MAVAQLVRARLCGRRGRRFETGQPPQMQIVFHFPPENLFSSLLIWCASLVFVKWIVDLYKNRNKGITVTKIMSRRKLPFFIVPGKADKEYIENKLHRKVMGVSYIHGSRLKG